MYQKIKNEPPHRNAGAKDKAQRFKKTKEAKSRVLLATTEDEAVASVPEGAGMTVAAAEPQGAIVVLDDEDAEAAVAVGDGFHCDAEPFALGLVAVLQAQSGADFGGAELEAEFNRLGADVAILRAILEAEVSNREHNEVEVDFFLGAGNPAEDVVAPVADVHTRLLERLAVLIGLLAGSELHRLPDGHLDGLGRRDDPLARVDATEHFARVIRSHLFSHFLGGCVDGAYSFQKLRNDEKLCVHLNLLMVSFPLIRGGCHD